MRHTNEEIKKQKSQAFEESNKKRLKYPEAIVLRSYFHYICTCVCCKLSYRWLRVIQHRCQETNLGPLQQVYRLNH